jgi:hypothetical protein
VRNSGEAAAATAAAAAAAADTIRDLFLSMLLCLRAQAVVYGALIGRKGGK